MTDRPSTWMAGAMIAAALLPTMPLAAQEAAPPATAATARSEVSDMSCDALKAEMDEHSARTQQASDAMQAATADMMAAQTREAARREKRRRSGSGLGLLSMGTQLAGFLPGGGVMAGLTGGGAGLMLSAAAKRGDGGDAAVAAARDLAQSRRKGEEAAVIAIRQQTHIGRMQEVLTALTARKCV